MGKRTQGKCALCRKNSTPIKSVSGDKIMKDNERLLWEILGLFYKNQQQGMGQYSL